MDPKSNGLCPYKKGRLGPRDTETQVGLEQCSDSRASLFVGGTVPGPQGMPQTEGSAKLHIYYRFPLCRMGQKLIYSYSYGK